MCFEPIAASFPYTGTDYKFSIRLDHTWNSSNQFMFRYNMANIDEIESQYPGVCSGRHERPRPAGWTTPESFDGKGLSIRSPSTNFKSSTTTTTTW